MKYLLKYKYRFIALFIFVLLAVDLLLHKGIVRVLLPKEFPSHPLSQRHPPNIKLITINKQWAKAINTPDLLNNLPAQIGGFETDVYFDTAKSYFDVHHDIDNSNGLNLETILVTYDSLQLDKSIWLDFKNLSPGNTLQALSELVRLRKRYNLTEKIIVESSDPSLLKSFADSGFYTSYYVPYFNPYLINNDSLLRYVEKIKTGLEHSTVQSLSGYYFQAPCLHHYFPNYPLLVWGTHDRLSLVNRFYNWQLGKKTEIFITLYNL